MEERTYTLHIKVKAYLSRKKKKGVFSHDVWGYPSLYSLFMQSFLSVA